MGIGDWFRKTFGKGEGEGQGDADTEDEDQPKHPKAHWLEPDDEGNPFGVRLLSLMENLKMTSWTGDPDNAARWGTWRAGGQRDVDVYLEGEAIPCDLRYPAPADFPEGMLYRPEQMEDKWVLAYRDGRVAAARSWTGETKAVAKARHDGKQLILSEITFAKDSGFTIYGDPIAAFDWLIRAHALGVRIPFPADAKGIEMLAAVPLSCFSLYGRQMFCAAADYDLGEAKGRLHSDGDLIAAVAAGDAERMAEALGEGAPVNAPSSFSEGATALHLAIYLHPELLEPLLKAGANVNAGSLHGSTPLMAAASAGRPELVPRLLEAGADLHAADEAGFTAAHVAAQFGRPQVLAALVERGASLSQKTNKGFTPLHIAAGTGKRAAVEWMIEHGVDPGTPSPMGTALEIAQSEGHKELVAFLRDRQ